MTLNRLRYAILLFVAGLVVTNAPPVHGQTFSSGSNGSDGALNLTTPGTIIFDPKTFSPPLDPDGDSVYHFTTINIAAGVTVKLSSNVLSGPVYWLAQGAVTINGIVDLNGETGYSSTTLTTSRIPAAGGAGGYSGGLGGVSLNPNLPAPRPGNGPGGGIAAVAPNGSSNANGGNGSFTGSQYLIPLIGGSGGGGGSNGAQTPTGFGGGGGGGGGAILIASSVSITYGGTIRANGGPGFFNDSAGGGGGSGGAIRLIAPIISDIATGDSGCRPFGSIHGSIQATGSAGNNGLIRLEAFTLLGNIFIDCVRGIQSTPFSLALPATPPSSIKVTNINGIPINANPFSFPDATINTSSPVTVNVQAQYMPTGTIPKIIVFSETGPDQTVNCSALTGTLQQSTCSASITFPTGGSRGFVKATW